MSCYSKFHLYHNPSNHQESPIALSGNYQMAWKKPATPFREYRNRRLLQWKPVPFQKPWHERNPIEEESGLNAYTENEEQFNEHGSKRQDTSHEDPTKQKEKP